LVKLSRPTLDIPPAILNWIVHFLTGRTEVTKGSDSTLSGFHAITQGILQGSGIGPTLWIIMESDLHSLSAMNVLVKYTDDTNLLVPENTDVPLADEYAQIKDWAVKNCVKINPEKKLKNWCFDDLIQRNGMCLLLSKVLSRSRLLSC